jgi:hypothetical protein
VVCYIGTEEDEGINAGSYPLAERPRGSWHEDDGRAATQLLTGTKVGDDSVELGWAVGPQERKEHRESGARLAQVREGF